MGYCHKKASFQSKTRCCVVWRPFSKSDWSPCGRRKRRRRARQSALSSVSGRSFNWPFGIWSIMRCWLKLTSAKIENHNPAYQKSSLSQYAEVALGQEKVPMAAAADNAAYRRMREHCSKQYDGRLTAFFTNSSSSIFKTLIFWSRI